MGSNRRLLLLIAACVVLAPAGLALAQDAKAPTKPNILVIWGDDIGQSNISAYTRGMMGYRTPNIDRIAKEGILFTDYYGGAVLHGRPGLVHPRPERVPHRSLQGRVARRREGHQHSRSRRSPSC
jgi:hypothetical protein